MVDLETKGGPVPSINPGVSGYNIDLKKRDASLMLLATR